MDLRDMASFLTLAQLQHFSQSAESLHITPSTLSRQIQRLEGELGYQLFIRDNRSVKITQAGRIFQQFAQQTLLNHQQFVSTLQSTNEIISGELRLFCSVTAAYSHLPAILDRFRASYPQIEIKLTTGDAADALEKIENESVDLAIAGRPATISQRIEFFQIGKITMSLIYPILNPTIYDKLNHAQKPDWSQLPFILPEHGPSRRQIERWLKQNHILHPLIYATVGGHEAIVSMVALGCGIALIPDVVVENSPESVRTRIAKLNYPTEIAAFDLGVCVPKDKLTQRHIAAFWQTLQTSS